MKESDEFISNLKRFNVKERNFLMRYALSQTLSVSFTNDLIEHLQKTGMPGLDGAKVEYFGMDYHLEWINAALLLATKELQHNDNEPSNTLLGGQARRVEDVDLLVVLSRVDGKVVMVLIEAKGIGSFDTEQFGKKIERLRAMKSPWIDSNGSRKPIEWLTPIMLLMSPKKPSKDTCTAFCEQLASLSDDYGRIRFWPIARSADPSLLWLKLKAFGDYHGEKSKFLRVTTCYENGSRAKNKSDRTENSYKHWRVEPRGFLET